MEWNGNENSLSEKCVCVCGGGVGGVFLIPPTTQIFSLNRGVSFFLNIRTDLKQ